MKGPSFITLKVPIFYYIDQDYLTLFFCVESDFVIYVNKGVTCNAYLRYIADWRGLDLRYIFLLKIRLQFADQCKCVYLYTTHTTAIEEDAALSTTQALVLPVYQQV